MKILGIITARGGSKGIPHKNIKELLGKPLLAYTVEAAQESDIFDRIILSTDDKKIADVGNRYGVEVPFVRPQGLAEDGSSTLSVLSHAVGWLAKKENYKPDLVAILQPTAPLRQAWHLREALELLKQKNADSVVGVTEIPRHFSPHWAAIEAEDGFSKLFNGEPLYKRNHRRQELEKTYFFNGGVYMFKPELLFSKEPNFYGEKSAIYKMEPKYSVNIDEPEDWGLAERGLRELAGE